MATLDSVVAGSILFDVGDLNDFSRTNRIDRLLVLRREADLPVEPVQGAGRELKPVGQHVVSEALGACQPACRSLARGPLYKGYDKRYTYCDSPRSWQVVPIPCRSRGRWLGSKAVPPPDTSREKGKLKPILPKTYRSIALSPAPLEIRV